MKNKIAYILCFMTVGVFLMIFIQDKTKLFKFKELNGVYYSPQKVECTFDNLYNGSYQKHLEEDIRYCFGFREVLIRIYNQYLWDFYHKSSNYTIMIGKDDWLFGRDGVINYYQSSMYQYTNDRNEMKRQFNLEAQRMYKVQNILNDYGIFIFVSLLPTKTFLFPEYVPENPGLTLKPFHGIEYYPHVFDSLGINYINLKKVFDDKKGKVDYPLFPKTGKHWTTLASAYAFDTTLRYVEKYGKMNLTNYTIGEKYPCEPIYPDNDLELVLNHLRPIKNVDYFYADIHIDSDETAIKPKFIVIGDSYFWNINKIISLKWIFSSYSYWYYNSTIHFDPKHNHTSEVDILDEIFSSKVIDLSYSPEQLYVFSNKFLPKALLYLTHEDSEIDSVLNIVSKDELFAEPEKFFPDLSTDSIPITRNSRISNYSIY